MLYLLKNRKFYVYLMKSQIITKKLNICESYEVEIIIQDINLKNNGITIFLPLTQLNEAKANFHYSHKYKYIYIGNCVPKVSLYGVIYGGAHKSQHREYILTKSKPML